MVDDAAAVQVDLRALVSLAVDGVILIAVVAVFAAADAGVFIGDGARDHAQQVHPVAAVIGGVGHLVSLDGVDALAGVFDQLLSAVTVTGVAGPAPTSSDICPRSSSWKPLMMMLSSVSSLESGSRDGQRIASRNQRRQIEDALSVGNDFSGGLGRQLDYLT